MIARIMRMLNMMEEWGSGYQRINDTCLTGGYPEPEWQELGAAVRVVFRPHPDVEKMNVANDPVNERQKWFLEQLAIGEKSRSTDLIQRWNVSQVTAKRDIADLKDRRKIEYVGSPKTGWYRLK